MRAIRAGAGTGLVNMNLELRLPPVVVVAIAALLMLALDRAFPGLAFSWPPAKLAAGVVGSVGVLTAALGVLAFRRSGTTVDPRYPEKAAQLVTAGIYRFTRNPMYLGMALALAGGALLLGNWLCFVVLPLFMAYLSRFQIRVEERHMDALFGDAFTRYRARVRRWL